MPSVSLTIGTEIIDHAFACEMLRLDDAVAGYVLSGDAEDLAEGGIALFLGEHAPLFRHLGVAIEAAWKGVPGKRTVRDGRTGEEIHIDLPSGGLTHLSIQMARNEALVPVLDEHDDTTYTVRVGADAYPVVADDGGVTDSWMNATAVAARILERVVEGHHLPWTVYASSPGTNDATLILTRPGVADGYLRAHATPSNRPWWKLGRVAKPDPVATLLLPPWVASTALAVAKTD